AHARSGGLRLNLDAALAEEAADAADDSLAVAHDDRVVTELFADLREQRLERLAAIGAGRRVAHRLTDPAVSTFTPGAISVYAMTASCGKACSTSRRTWRRTRLEHSTTG